jgi:hypothetical protein
MLVLVQVSSSHLQSLQLHSTTKKTARQQQQQQQQWGSSKMCTPGCQWLSRSAAAISKVFSCGPQQQPAREAAASKHQPWSIAVEQTPHTIHQHLLDVRFETKEAGRE